MQEHKERSDRPVDWRAHFISLAEDMCRLHGQPAAAIVDDPDNYLSMRVPLDGMDFDVLHFPDAPERLVVHCRLGRVHDEPDGGILGKALAANMPLARAHAGMFGLDDRTGELVYSTGESLRDLTADKLRQDMSVMAGAAKTWLQHCMSPST